VTPEVQQHLNFARAKLAEAERIFERAELFPATARTAYLAALSAARAIIRHQTGRSPKTHSGTRSEISRLAHIDSRIDGSFAAFLVKGFEVKSDADYGDHFSDEVTRAEAVESLATATRLVAHAEWLLAQPEPPPAP
jgi:uncharacterized protein (UPF0332 family)